VLVPLLCERPGRNFRIEFHQSSLTAENHKKRKEFLRFLCVLAGICHFTILRRIATGIEA
jgi:hypothetical protein